MKNPSEILKQINILSSLSEDEFSLLYSLMRRLDIEPGEILFNEGDKGEELYIVVGGSISISVKVQGGGNVEVAVIKEGHFFGEMSIFDNAPRSATCSAREKTTLLAFNKEDFFDLVGNYPATAIKILYRMLSTTIIRLQETGSFLSDMVTWGENARKRAVTDDFTGLYNRRFLDDALEDNIAKARLSSLPLSLVMVDLDNFGKLNKEYGEETGDQVILSAVPVFREVFRNSDILARYGGDEFTFILPETEPEKALSLCSDAVTKLREIDILKDRKGKIKKVTASIGIASYPLFAETIEELREKADLALYRAKEGGRDSAVLFKGAPAGVKKKIATIAGKKRIVSRITEAVDSNSNFLLVGHKNPDEDCVSSMIAFALLLAKLNKNASVVIRKEHQNKFPYLINIGKYNSIKFIESDRDITLPDSVIISVDTPKPSMTDCPDSVVKMISDPGIIKIEIDHHLGADSGYIGDYGYCLVDEASSACELIGYFALKLTAAREILEKYHVSDLLSRNFVLSVITGMISDSKMGKYLKTNREKWFYNYFSSLFNDLLYKKTDTGSGNFSTMEDVFAELEKLSEEEDSCYRYLSERKKSSAKIGYIILSPEEMEYLYSRYSNEIIVTVARYAADVLAEESGFISLVVYHDNPEKSSLVQFRMRRNHDYRDLDLRKVIERFKIENGGGHPGAVGFRIPAEEAGDVRLFAEKIISGTEKMMGNIK